MILFKSVKWKNFLSTGNTPTKITLNKVASVLITGSNGSGKSTLLDAICYGLFNKPYRNINKPQLINSVNEKNLEVEIEFEVNNVDFKVIRGVKPAKFEIWRNGSLIEHDAAIKDYQKRLEDILGLNFKAFTQIVVLGSARYQSFMDLSTNDRRGIIEELLDITVFSKMNAILKTKNSENELEIRENDYQKDIMQTKVDGQKSLINNIINRSKTSKKKLDADTAKINLEVSNLDDKISNLTEEIASNVFSEEAFDKTSAEMQQAKFKAQDVQQHLQKLAKKQKFFTETSSCPTCLQEIDSEIKNNQLTELQTDQEKYEALKPLIVDAFKSLEDNLTEQKDNRTKLFESQTKLTDLQATRKGLVNQLNKMNESIDEEDDETLETEKIRLESYETQVIQYTTESTRLSELKHYYDICKVLLRDEGIKSKIIKQYLPIMNALINQNLDRMGANYSFNLDEQFNEVIKSRYRDNFSYASFSEGEKMRIDLALMFCWREIAKLKNSISTNLLILDEIGDSSLDGDGSDILWEMIGDMQDSNVFVISHKTSNVDRFSSHFEFRKEGNFSKIVNSKFNK